MMEVSPEAGVEPMGLDLALADGEEMRFAFVARLVCFCQYLAHREDEQEPAARLQHIPIHPSQASSGKAAKLSKPQLNVDW